MAKTKATTPVDPKRVALAMKRIAPLLAKLPKEQRVKEKDIREVALDGVAVAHRPKSVEVSGRPVVAGGDFVIEGSLDFAGVCVVLGDLHVEGVIECQMDYDALVVGGSIRARGINCTDFVFAVGAIEADVVFIETDGHLFAGEGIRTKLAVLEDGEVDVKGRLQAEEKVVLTYPESRGIDELREILAPEAFGVVDGDDVLFDYTNLFAALRKGKPWRRASGQARPKSTSKKHAAKPAANGARTFELVEGTSKKFWAVATRGGDLTTRYGRIGTAGQQTTKSFGSPAEAREAAEKLVREKTRKGYVESG